MIDTFEQFPAYLKAIVGLAALVCAAYLLLPLLIKSSFKQRADPHFDYYDPEESLPPLPVIQLLDRTSEQMKQAGFSLVDYISLPDQMPNVVAIGALFANYQENDAAMAVMIWAFEGNVKIQNEHVEFSTEFDDGSIVDTNSNVQEGAFAPVENKWILQFPRVKDAAKLYRVHQRALQEFTSGKTKKRLPPEDLLVEGARQGMINELTGQIGTGYLYLDADGEYFRPTWKGAYLMCWKMMWPVSTVRRILRNRKANSLLAEWGMEA